MITNDYFQLQPLLQSEEAHRFDSLSRTVGISDSTEQSSSFQKALHYFLKFLPWACIMGRRTRPFIVLRDGRRLRYTIDGPTHLLSDPITRNSLPVIFAFHGMFLSGDCFLQHSTPVDYVVVCMNRPGYHGSSVVTIGEYTYTDFAKDVEELANHLGIDKFSVVGHSSGGPNALASASYMKDRVLSVAIMAGDPEYSEVNKETTHEDDDRTTQADEQVRSSSWMDWFLGLCLPNFMLFVPFIQVTNGLKNDFYIERQKYPFRTEDIVQPAVVVLGDQDNILPIEVAVKVHHRLPNSQLIMLTGVGHNQLLEDDVLDMVFRRVIELVGKNVANTRRSVDIERDDVKNDHPKQYYSIDPPEQSTQTKEQNLLSSSAEKTIKVAVNAVSVSNASTMDAVESGREMSTSSSSPLPCWKCNGRGRKYEKSTKDYTGSTCKVCDGNGTRPASEKSILLSRKPGEIQSLRGYPDNHPLRSHFPDRFANPRAFYHQGTERIPSHLLPSVGEVVASLGCSDWRIYQLQHGNKLTVDDFICAFVAAQEMMRRGWLPERKVITSHGDILLGGMPVIEATRLFTSNPAEDSVFTHADLGTGCGSVLMTIAWAFFGQVRAVGVEAQDVSFHCLKRGVEWNMGSDGTHDDDAVRIQQTDLRTWEGDSVLSPPYDLITGTPPYFPLDSFVASQNHEQKFRCRIPTRGGAPDYIRTAARLLKGTDKDASVPDGGVFCMVEAAFDKASDLVEQTARECGMKVQRRLDVTTREGLPPRFSCWVMIKPSTTIINCDSVVDVSFPIETLTLRNEDLTRTKAYSAAMESMGWVDFETHRASSNI